MLMLKYNHQNYGTLVFWYFLNICLLNLIATLMAYILKTRYADAFVLVLVYAFKC